MIALAIVASFLVVPLVELFVLVRVAHLIGLLPALGLLLLFSIAGAALVRREGARAARAVTGALAAGRLPGREATDGFLVLLGGALLLTPGFVTDAAGLLLVLPLTRPLARRGLMRVLRSRIARAVPGPPAGGTRRAHRERPGRRIVIEGEWVPRDGAAGQRS